MTLNEKLTLIAITLSPVIAVVVSIVAANRKERRDRKYAIFLTLFSERHRFIGNENALRALNAVDAVFVSSVKVRAAWKAYFELLNQPDSVTLWASKYAELLKAIADDLGFGNALDHADINRVYMPKWMNPQPPDETAAGAPDAK